MARFKYSLKLEQNEDLDLDAFLWIYVIALQLYGSEWTEYANSDAYKSEP